MPPLWVARFPGKTVMSSLLPGATPTWSQPSHEPFKPELLKLESAWGSRLNADYDPRGLRLCVSSRLPSGPVAAGL